MPLSAPPRNSVGQTIPHNHEQILENDGVIRRISDLQIVTDSVGRRKVSSMALQASSEIGGYMSVDLEAPIIEAGLDVGNYVTSPLWTGSIRFTAGELRQEELQVGFDPLPMNPYHGAVWGQFSRGKQRRLLSIATWLVPVSGVALG